MEANSLLSDDAFDPSGEVEPSLVESLRAEFLATGEASPIGVVPIALRYFRGGTEAGVVLVRLLKLVLDPETFRLVCGAILKVAPFEVVGRGHTSHGENMN